MNPLYSLFSLLALCLILLTMIGWLTFILIRLGQSQSARLSRENQELRNRLMTHSWMEFGNLQQIQSPTVSNSNSDAEVRGMSDEEELRRVGLFQQAQQGVGEVLIDEHGSDESIEQWFLRP